MKKNKKWKSKLPLVVAIIIGLLAMTTAIVVPLLISAKI